MPPAIAPRTSGRTTRPNVRAGRSPSSRLLSSSCGGSVGQAGGDGQVDERIGEQREHEHGGAEAAEPARRVVADELEDVAEHAVGAEPGDERGGADERREHQRQRGEDPPQPAPAAGRCASAARPAPRRSSAAAVVTRAASCTVRHAGASDSASTSRAVAAERERPPDDVQHRGGERDGDDDADEVEGDRRSPRCPRRGTGSIGRRRLVGRGDAELGRRDGGEVVHSALEPGVADHLPRRLEVAAEVVEVEVDVARRGEVDVGQHVGRLDAGGQRVLEGLVGEVALGLLAEQELDQLAGLVGVVGAGQHRRRRDDDEAADVVGGEVVVAPGKSGSSASAWYT